MMWLRVVVGGIVLKVRNLENMIRTKRILIRRWI